MFWALPDTPFPSWGVQDWAPTEMWAPSLPWHHIILRLPTLLCSEKLQQTEGNLVLQENKVKYSTVPITYLQGSNGAADIEDRLMDTMAVGVIRRGWDK